jgi:phage terminase large subunit
MARDGQATYQRLLDKFEGLLNIRLRPRAATLPVVVWPKPGESHAELIERVHALRPTIPEAKLLLVATWREPASLPENTRAVVFVEPALKALIAKASYVVIRGGRGGGKSFAVGRYLLLRALEAPLRIACLREFQTSLRESVHELLRSQIEELDIGEWFKVREREITSAAGAVFFFRGLRHNVSSIRSTESIDVAWCEESEVISKTSWEVLLPTIRKPGSRIITTFNPRKPEDPCWQQWQVAPPPSTVHAEVNFRDNPWISRELLAQQRHLATVDPLRHAWIWLGHFDQKSESVVLQGKVYIEEFEPGPNWDGPYHGCDFGFSRDPTTLVRVWLHDGCLFLSHEFCAVGAELDAVPRLFKDAVPGCERHTIRADSAQPGNISYLQRYGLPNMVGVTKWAGSVEDGISHLRSYRKIVVHPRCTAAAEQARLWSFKVDRLSGDVLPTLVPGNDDVWDAARYALQPLIARGDQTPMEYLRMQLGEAQIRAAAARETALPELIGGLLFGSQMTEAQRAALREREAAGEKARIASIRRRGGFPIH